MQALFTQSPAGGGSVMDGTTWFLIGVLTGVFITVACSALAFGRAVKDLNDRGEPNDDV